VRAVISRGFGSGFYDNCGSRHADMIRLRDKVAGVGVTDRLVRYAVIVFVIFCARLAFR
jgi:hypothetical protein